jgi:FkbM family methyltransferase
MQTEDIDPNHSRIELTASCRDCDSIPKVADAGRILDENGQSVQIMHNGIRVVAGGYHGAWMSKIIARLRGHHEPQEEAVFDAILRHLPRQAVMLELGGFWSYYSLWFLRQAPENRRAIVLEPDPAHIAIGQQNARLNGADKIEFLQGAVGAAPIIEQTFHSESSGEITVRCYSISEILSSCNIDHLHLLHCDTQGAETSVISSSEALFRDHQIAFGVFSTHAHQISGDPLTHQRCLAMLRDFGGQILAEHDVHESYSGDGLIVAYFGKDASAWEEVRLSVNRYSNGIFRNPIYDLADAQQTLERQAARINELELERNALTRQLEDECGRIVADQSRVQLQSTSNPPRSVFEKIIGRLVSRR